jgi:hypothetical protein
MKRLLFSFIAFAILSGLCSAIDGEQAVMKASYYSSQLGMSFQTSQARAKKIGSVHDQRWMVFSGENIIVLDNAEGRLLLIEDSAKENRLRNSTTTPTNLAIDSDPSAWNQATKFLNRLGLATEFYHRSVSRYTLGVNQDENRRGRTIVRFEVRPHGFGTFGNGNKAVLTLDTQTGDLVSLELETRWIYLPPPPGRIGAQAANNAARSLVGEAQRTEIGYFAPNGEFGSATGLSMLRGYVSKLSYCVTSSQGSTIVDASTGQILGGGRFAGQRAPTGERPRIRRLLRVGHSALSDGAKLAAAFGYSHIADSKIGSDLRGSKRIYYFTENHRTSEIWMSKIVAKSSYPEVGVFLPTADGPKLDQPITDRKSALRVLVKVLDVIGGNDLRIASFNLSKGYSAGNHLYKNRVLAKATGTLKLSTGMVLRFSAIMIPPSGRFMSWSAWQQ